MLNRGIVHKLVDQMPENFSADDLVERVILLQKIEIGRQEIKDGKSYTEEEMDEMIDSWE